jgi:hypothetical protein
LLLAEKSKKEEKKRIKKKLFELPKRHLPLRNQKKRFKLARGLPLSFVKNCFRRAAGQNTLVCQKNIERRIQISN